MGYRVQIDDDVRQATADEAARIEAAATNHAEHVAMIEAQTAAKVSARTKLKAMGLTDDEIAALVG